MFHNAFRICCCMPSHAGSTSCSIRCFTRVFFSPRYISTIFAPDVFVSTAATNSSRCLRTDSRIKRLILFLSAASGTRFLGTEKPNETAAFEPSVNTNPVSSVPWTEIPPVMTLVNDWYPRRMIDLGSVCRTHTAAS